MKIYYRGYVIDHGASSIDYTVLGRRPVRLELAAHANAQQAMKWIDGEVSRCLVIGQGWA